MPPEDVARWVRRVDAWGAELYVMYGQTEATARMAYLPPAVARRRPDAVGVAIPGGELEVRAAADLPPGAGELVYRGPNVMLGYALEPADLAAGATIDELRTGDIARFDADDGVFEIIGRRTRFVKPFGLRIDLDHVERTLAATWPDIAVAGDDDHLVVVVPHADPHARGPAVRRAVADLTGLPPGVVAVVAAAVPTTASGKVDQGAILRLGEAARCGTDDDGAIEPDSVAAVYAAVLGRSDVSPRSTFVSLGGDSLNYIECSLQLERLLGRVPGDWHVRTVAELGAVTPARRRPTIDTTVLLRAVGICAVVATHMHLRFIPGGAHLMLAVAGYNLSRFQLPIERTAERVRAGLRTVARAAAPTVAWVAVGLALGVSYGTGTLLLVNNYVGPASHRDDHWHFWFIEVFVHLTLLTTLVLAVPCVRRASQRYPYAFPLALVLASLLLRLEWAQADDWYNLRYRTHGIAWFFLLGWLVHRSETTRQRLLTTALCLLTVPGFFQLAQRDWFITVGLVVLVWCRSLPCPAALRRPVSTLAAASMWIFITHFTVWPPLDAAFEREVAYVLTVAVGVGTWIMSERVARAARRLVPLHPASPSARISESTMCADADAGHAGQTLVSSVGTSGSTGAPGPSSSGRSSASVAPTV
jgi:hypothetical protein